MPRNPNKIDYSGNFPQCFEAFKTLIDPRSGGNTKHHFGAIVFMAYTSVLCGITNYECMEEFCESNTDWFSKWITLPNGIPCSNTFARVFEAINPESFAQCISLHLQFIGHKFSDRHIAIDGKALRGSKSSEDRHIHAVSAWACESEVTLAQRFVDDKSNEITAIPELLKSLNLEGCVVSLDAMGAQTKITDQIIEQKADYVISVKANQKQLFDEVENHFDFALKQLTKAPLNKSQWRVSETKEVSRNRDELRQTVTCHDLSWMNNEIKNRWKKLSSLTMVYRYTILEDGLTRKDVSYYMSSLKNTNAAEIQHYIRKHWSIENSCHWTLDVIFKEDANQVTNRNAAKNLSTMRRIALTDIKQAPEISKRKKPASLTKKQLRAAHNTHYREQCLSLV